MFIYRCATLIRVIHFWRLHGCEWGVKLRWTHLDGGGVRSMWTSTRRSY